MSLRPKAPALYIDRDYLLYAVGLLAAVEPETAFAMGYGGIERRDTETAHGQRSTG